MDIVSQRPLRGRRILIVESEAKLLFQLIHALENKEDAETFLVTDPHSDAGARRLSHFTSSAAVINSAHRRVAKALDVPALVYGIHTPVPPEPGAIVRALKTLLAGWP